MLNLRTRITVYRIALFCGVTFLALGGFAQTKNIPTPKKTMSRAPNGVSDSQRALEVRGQSRNLSMLLVLKNRKDAIDFVKPRENYNDEIKNTGF